MFSGVKSALILSRKNLPISDLNLPTKNVQSPYLGLRMYHMYGVGTRQSVTADIVFGTVRKIIKKSVIKSLIDHLTTYSGNLNC